MIELQSEVVKTDWMRALLLELCAGEGIAHNLAILGIKGKRWHPVENPASVYLCANGFKEVEVDPPFIKERYGLWNYGNYSTATVWISGEVACFLNDFNSGKYPDLEVSHVG